MKLRIPIARLGKWHHPVYGVVKFDEQDFSDIQANFKKNIRGYEPYLRYGHNEKGPGIHDGERALGFLEDLKKEGDVLWGVFNPTNEKVIEEVKNKEYKYASAEIVRNAKDKETGEPITIFLKGQSLTNAPFIPNLPSNEIISNHANEELFSEKGETIFFFSDLTKDKPMVELSSEVNEQKNSEISFMKRFFQKFLALADQMEAMDTEEKATPQVAIFVEQKEEQQEMQNKDAQIQELTDKLSALEAQVSQLLADKKMPEKQKKEEMCEDCEKPMSECGCEEYSEATPAVETPAQQVAKEPPAKEEEKEVVTEEEVPAVEEVAQQAAVEAAQEEDPAVVALKEKLAAMEAELQQVRASQEEAAKAEAEKAFARLLSDRVVKAVSAGVYPEKANMAANLVKALRTQAQQSETVMLSDGESPVDLTEAVFSLLSEGQIDFDQAGAEVQTMSTQELSENPYRDRIEALRSRNSKK